MESSGKRTRKLENSSAFSIKDKCEARFPAGSATDIFGTAQETFIKPNSNIFIPLDRIYSLNELSKF
jgi:hypothetical protein